MQPDENLVRNLIHETLVIPEKEYGRWNWDLILELFITVLRHPFALNDTLRNTSFVRRLLFFYKPSSNQFSDLLSNKANLKFLQAGCEIIDTMTSCMDGVKYLYENGLFREISQWLSLSFPVIY